jgi:hypothetical protein
MLGSRTQRVHMDNTPMIEATRLFIRTVAHPAPGCWARDIRSTASTALRTLEQFDHQGWLYRSHHAVPSLDLHYRAPHPITDADVILCQRLIDAYVLAERESPSTPGMWTHEIFRERHRTLIDALARHDATSLAERLASMFRSEFVVGMATGNLGVDRKSRLAGWFWTRYALSKLTALAESQGVAPMENPEQGDAGLAFTYGADVLVANTERAIGASIDFPDVGAAYGIEIAGRLISSDSPDQIYAAARLRSAIETYLPDRAQSIRLVEIGGGYGGMAYWLMRMMPAEYVIVDLPLINVIQGYFLTHALGASEVSFYGEAPRNVALFPTHAISEIPLPFHVLANKDSLPEIPRSAALDYLRWARQGCDGLFYSYNQESAAWTLGGYQNVVLELVNEIEGFDRLRRDTSWLRQGYAEEIYAVSAA